MKVRLNGEKRTRIRNHKLSYTLDSTTFSSEYNKETLPKNRKRLKDRLDKLDKLTYESFVDIRRIIDTIGLLIT